MSGIRDQLCFLFELIGQLLDQRLHSIMYKFQPLAYQDEDGYPPDQWETMWAKETGSGLYSVDNIPFFTRGVSPGDVVRVRKEDGTLIFDGVVNPSPASVFRIFVSNSADVQAARDEFREMGCESELSYITRLFAVEVPGTVDFGQVAKLLAKGTETGRWEYEEGALRHNLPAE